MCFTYFLLHLQTNPNTGGDICPSDILDCSHLFVVNANNILANLKILLVNFLLEFVVVCDWAGVKGWFVDVNSFLTNGGAPGI